MPARPTLTRSPVALLGLALLLAAALLLPRAGHPEVAFAHTSVQSKRPPEGRTAKTNITVVVAVFSGSLRTARLIVTGPGGQTVSTGTSRDPKNRQRYMAKLKSGLKPGAYKVRASWTSTDNHKQNASWGFKLER